MRSKLPWAHRQNLSGSLPLRPPARLQLRKLGGHGEVARGQSLDGHVLGLVVAWRFSASMRPGFAVESGPSNATLGRHRLTQNRCEGARTEGLFRQSSNTSPSQHAKEDGHDRDQQ